MIDLDELLTGAADRLDDATSHLAIPDAPRPSRPVGRIVAIGACAAAAIGGVIVVRSSDHRTLRPAQDPPGLYDGTYGDEITLTEVPDGDDDPTTWKLVASPAGGEVSAERTVSEGRLTTSVAAGSSISATTAPDTVFADAAPSGGDPGLCITTSNTGGVCGSALDELTLQLGFRGDDGQVLTTGVPAGAAAVTFQSGDVQYWTRPVHGVALFPYPASASNSATVTVLDALGGTLATRSERNSTLTDAEVAAAVVTHGTGQRIAGGWYTSPDIAVGGASVAVRLEGRTGQSGFGGPFASQALALDTSANSWLVVLTVATSDLSEVTDRLAADESGSVRRTIDEPDGVAVLIWTSDDVPDSVIDTAVARLTTTNPPPEMTISLDQPRSFHAMTSYSLVATPAVVTLVTDTVTASDGTQLRVECDDLGDVWAKRLDDDHGEAVDAGPHAYVPAALPEVGQHLFPLTAVPADVTSLTVTLDDRTTLDLPLADLRPYADAKVAIAPPIDNGRSIASVDAR